MNEIGTVDRVANRRPSGSSRHGGFSPFSADWLGPARIQKGEVMSAQSFSLAEILTKLGDDWAIVKNRFDRYQSKVYIGDDEAWEQEDENRWEALHNHPFPSVLERVTVWTGISSKELREATLKHFDGYSDFVGKLRRLDDKGQTRGLWEMLVKECPSVILEAGLMPYLESQPPEVKSLDAGREDEESASNTATARKPKRSTERGEAEAKLIAALTKHHQYAEGGCMKWDPIGSNVLAEKAKVGKGSANRFFNKWFGSAKEAKDGYRNYRIACNGKDKLIAILKSMNGDMPRPGEVLFGREVPTPPR